MHKFITVLFGLMFFTVTLKGQSISPIVLATAGNSSVNSEAIIEWTIGEPVIVQFINGANVLTQGFHQPEIKILTSNIIEENFSILIYPNPAIDKIHIESKANYTWSLYDLDGKMLDQNISPDVQMWSYAKGVYFLCLNIGQNEKAFKIIKQ